MPTRPSVTAEVVCLVRAREQALPRARRVVDDPFAGPFLEAAGSPLVRVGGARGPVAAAADLAFKAPLVGFASLVLARHRIMDDLLLAETASGAEQCVVLGAGYDARPYRFPAPAGPARYFEVDHPTLSDLKRDLVGRVLGRVPPEVTFVTVDFQRDALADRLRSAGFDPARRTVFIWEGVTYYLAPEAVRATLGAVRSLSAPGSAVVFDAWSRRSDRGGGLLDAARALSRAVARALSEPFLFLLDAPEAVRPLLADAGFDVLFHHERAAMREVLRAHGRRLLHVPPHLVVAAGRAPGAPTPAHGRP